MGPSSPPSSPESQPSYSASSKVRVATNTQETGVQRFIVASCYWALIFNIGAAISSFVMIDYLGEIPYHASKLPKGLLHVGGEVPADGANVLLRRYSGHGDSAVWLWISFHWLICLFCGILTLIVAILAYVWAEELLWVKLTTFGAVVFVVIPPFILVAWQRHT
ncbi:hypothetical protein DFP72DRAFT_852455 [Ephemerocybe angulata]|uniref:Uncharacterized protein n=1 Tax=Ephemerocybe angulata TaxID=980116 RepID=A0A8H6LZ97_9AGAR|nr:hypothetical protein DFP72DRAFT_852455 [Tulosesus angulatus]